MRWIPAAAILLLLLVSSCGRRGALTVGSKNFTEQLILGEVVAQQIERCVQVPVERRLNLGGTLLAHQAIVSGEIDIYPEYTGTALTAVLNEDPPRDASQVFARVADAYAERYGVVWLPPLGFENTFAMAIRNGFAQKHRLRTLSDAAASPLAWRLGVGYEFEQRPDGLPGLLQRYPLRLEGAVRTMDLGLLYRAMEQGQVDMVAGNSTDGMLRAMQLTVLEDDQQYFPPYQAAILARSDALNRHAGLRGCLEELSGSLDERAMQKLNQAADEQRQTIAEIAAGFLEELPLRER